MRSLRVCAIVLVLLTTVSSSLFAAGPNCSVGPAGSTYSTIQAALDDAGCLVISVAAGTYTENLVVTRQVEINGAAAATTFLDGGGTNRVIDVVGGVPELKIRHVTLRNGVAIGNGGAIRSGNGRVFLDHVVVTGNSASGFGGGIYSAGGIADIVGSFITNNNAGGDGGGIALDSMSQSARANIADGAISFNSASGGGGLSMFGVMGGTLDVRRSLIASNESRSTSGPGGGGILWLDTNDATISNSTISGNRSNSDGGALTSAGFPFIQLTNVTITNNSSNGTGGIAAVFFFSMTNTIVSGNFQTGSSAPSDCSGTPDAPTLMSFGNNLFGSNGSPGNCPANGFTDLVPLGDVNTVIEALADNGGPSLTHLLADGSPARDAGATIDALGTDQRGFPRLRGAFVDIGAVEMGTPPTADAGGPYNVEEGGSVNVSGTGLPFPDENASDLTYAWDLDGDGSFETTGAVVTFSAATLDGPATRTIVLRVCDSENDCAKDSATVQVTNAAPQVTLSGATITEGGTAVVSGTATDPSSLDTVTVLISWGEGQGSTTLSLAAGVTSFSASKTYVDDGSFNISAVATDDDGGSNSATAAVVVTNLAPVVTAGPNIAANVGETVTATATFTDAGIADTHSATVNWNDPSPTEPASVVEANGSGSLSASHQYSAAGTFSVTMCVTDDDGASNCATLTATIAAPAASSGKITGGGLRTVNNGRGSFTIDGLRGELQFQNDTIKLHASDFTSIAVAADRKSATFAGVAKSGLPFSVYVEDNGEGGSDDIFKLWTDGVLQTGDGRLAGGNIQIHK